MEIYSIDECFLDVTHTEHLFGGSLAIAQAIKRRIREKLGLTCSIGIGTNKLLAKMASELKKPDGLAIIRPEELRRFLENLPVGNWHGVGTS